MHEFNVSLSTTLSSKVEFDCSVVEDAFKSLLVNEEGYSKEHISVAISRICDESKYDNPIYNRGQQLYSLVVTGSASGSSALNLGKILLDVLDNFAEKYITGYFLYCMYIERLDKKDFCVQTARKKVFHV